MQSFTAGLAVNPPALVAETAHNASVHSGRRPDSHLLHIDTTVEEQTLKMILWREKCLQKGLYAHSGVATHVQQGAL